MDNYPTKPTLNKPITHLIEGPPNSMTVKKGFDA